ncbi:MAG: hypothetical protein AVDCRST_MAG85-1214, partial [uncultured Solirubrobacteraceae bacterium]
ATARRSPRAARGRPRRLRRRAACRARAAPGGADPDQAGVLPEGAVRSGPSARWPVRRRARPARHVRRARPARAARERRTQARRAQQVQRPGDDPQRRTAGDDARPPRQPHQRRDRARLRDRAAVDRL